MIALVYLLYVVIMLLLYLKVSFDNPDSSYGLDCITINLDTNPEPIIVEHDYEPLLVENHMHVSEYFFRGFMTQMVWKFLTVCLLVYAIYTNKYNSYLINPLVYEFCCINLFVWWRMFIDYYKCRGCLGQDIETR